MEGKRPAFFKFFFPETSIEQLEIPSSFNRLVQGVLPDKVVLRDRYNNLWPVKVEKVQRKFYFIDGWTDFVDDNFVQGGDILFFEYSCYGLFDTKIHGKTACEKEGVGGYRVTKEQKKVVKEEEDVEKDDEEHEVRTEDDEGKEEQDEASVDDYELEHEMDDDEWEEEIPTNDSAMKRKQGTSSGTTGKAKRIRRVSDIYGREFFRAGMIPVPANPYFVTKINQKRKGELYIPKEVIRDNNLNLPFEISMFDPKGRKWTAKGKKWKDGRRYYTTGWRNLCQRNFIEKDDVCVIEFIERGRYLTMDVSIIRPPLE